MRTTFIEYLREEMIRTAEDRGSLTHPDVIMISQELDRFIVKLQRLNLTMCTDAERNSPTIVQPFETTSKYLVSFKPSYMNRFTQDAMEHSASSSNIT
jgi:hypothetical protein